jgi:hypothetical protein
MTTQSSSPWHNTTPAAAAGPGIYSASASKPINGPASSTHGQLARMSIVNPIKQILQQCGCFFFGGRTTNKTKGDMKENEEQMKGLVSTKKLNPNTPEEIKENIKVEKHRVESIKELMDSKQYSTALRDLMSDTAKDLHYFNHIKGEVLGDRHYEAFAEKHGKLLDFQERPPSFEQTNICLWSGLNDFGHPLRCHNRCMLQPVHQLGKERSKALNFCVYHVHFCVNSIHHPIPKRIRIPNDEALCNECYIMRAGHPPSALMRIPGTRRKRGDNAAL